MLTLIRILILLFLSTFVYADVTVVVVGQAPDTGVVEPFFEADWSTNSPAADDELCSSCGGCPDVWDVIENSDHMSVSGGKLVLEVDADVTRAILIDDDSGEILYGTSISEYWVEFKFEFTEVIYLETGTPQAISTSDYHYDFKIDEGCVTPGTICEANLTYFTDSGFSFVTDSFDPVKDTQYTARIHIKISSGPGANDGEADFVIVGESSGSASNIDNDTRGYASRMAVRTQNNMYNGSNSWQVKFDDYKMYIVDPGW